MAYQFNTVEDEKAALEGVKTEEAGALAAHDKTVNDILSEVDSTYKDAINVIGVRDENGKWNEGSMAAIQTDIANEQTDFAIKQIEQQKAWAEKDYKKEQSGAYTDWQKQSNQYGVNAEKKAAQGLAGTGYSESSQVGMYNTYQNRVAAARESFQRAKENYDNSIMQAQLQNSSVLAQIAADAQKEQLTLLLEGFQYKNTLVLEQAAQRRAIEQNYYTRYQDVLNQINLENKQKTAAEQEGAKIEKEREGTDNAGATAAAGTAAGAAKGAAKGAAEFIIAEKEAAALKNAMTRAEWTKWRKLYKATGTTQKPEVKEFDTYEDYVNAYLKWALS